MEGKVWKEGRKWESETQSQYNRKHLKTVIRVARTVDRNVYDKEYGPCQKELDEVEKSG